MKILIRTFLLCLVGLWLTGCAGQVKGMCDTTECDRPLSDKESIVIWWSAGMRAGLDDHKTWTKEFRVDQ